MFRNDSQPANKNPEASPAPTFAEAMPIFVPRGEFNQYKEKMDERCRFENIQRKELSDDVKSINKKITATLVTAIGILISVLTAIIFRVF